MVSSQNRHSDGNPKVERGMMETYSLKDAKILNVNKENYNTVSVNIEVDLKDAKVGQFIMFYAFGRGEAPITIADYKDGIMTNTIRIVGDVTGYFKDVKEGDTVYLRGPYGNNWPLEKAFGKDLVIISGGLGLAATRWVMEVAIQQKNRFRNILSLYGSKSYDDVLYKEKIKGWEKEIDFQTILNIPDKRWDKKVGLITDLIDIYNFSKDSVIFMCGPDPMVRACVEKLLAKQVLKENIYVSLERHMKCAVGTCGHCMIGPYFVCKNGPVFNYSEIEYFYTKKGV
jgi:NAD(P)H-flavin reductase